MGVAFTTFGIIIIKFVFINSKKNYKVQNVCVCKRVRATACKSMDEPPGDAGPGSRAAPFESFSEKLHIPSLLMSTSELRAEQQ